MLSFKTLPSTFSQTVYFQGLHWMPHQQQCCNYGLISLCEIKWTTWKWIGDRRAESWPLIAITLCGFRLRWAVGVQWACAWAWGLAARPALLCYLKRMLSRESSPLQAFVSESTATRHQSLQGEFKLQSKQDYKHYRFKEGSAHTQARRKPYAGICHAQSSKTARTAFSYLKWSTRTC